MTLSGGGAMHRPKRNSRQAQTSAEKKEAALRRATQFLGINRIAAIRRRWDSLDTSRHGLDSDGDVADGMLLVLKNCGLSHIEIQSIVKVGGSRLSRLYNFESNRNRSADRTKRTHAFNEMSVSLFQAFFSSLDVEDGFACGHRRPKMYVIGEDMTWKKLHEKYVSFVEGEKMKITDIHVRKNIKIMALTTFREYRGWLFPGHALDKKKEDVCDHCVRLQLVIDNPLTPPEEKEAAIIEKETHLDAAIDQ